MPRGTPSTQINVTVGSGGLSDKAKQLQTAARQAKLEGDRLTEVETTGTARRDQRLAQVGLSPQGVSLYAPDPRLPQIERRPAAYRINSANIGHIWTNSSPVPESFVSQGLTASNTGFDTKGNFITSRLGDVSSGIVAGNGASSVSSDTFTYVNFALPTNGYTWEPTYGAFYYAVSPGSGWYGYAYGLRTGRWTQTSQGLTQVILMFPAGNNATAIIVFSYSVQFAVDVTAMHYGSTGVITQGENNPPTQEQIQARFTALVQPGATVSIGYASDFDGQPVHPISAPVATVTDGSYHKNTVYLCTNSTIKEITPSEKLNDFLNWANPPLTTRSITIDLAAYDPIYVTVPALPATTETRLGQLVNLARRAGFIDPSAELPVRHTPEIFGSLNDIYPYTNPDNIILYDDSINKRVKPYKASGAYKNTFPTKFLYESHLPFKYSIDRKSASTTAKGSIFTGLQMSNARLPFGDTIINIFAAWDWNNPAYCKARLLDLGFTEADLTP